MFHTIEESSLEEIAAKYAVSVMDVRRWNREVFPAGETACMRPGMQIILYVTENSERK